MLVLLAGIAVSVTACNTIEGAGRDLSVGGDFVADTASDMNPQHR